MHAMLHAGLHVCCWTLAAQPACLSVMHAPARCMTPHSTHQHHRPTAPKPVLHRNCCCCRVVPAAHTQNSHAEATCALHIHEKAVGGLDQPLELVLGPLQLSWRVEQINIAVEHLQAETAADQHLSCVATPAKRSEGTAPGRHAGHSPTACCWCHLMLLQGGSHAAARSPSHGLCVGCTIQPSLYAARRARSRATVALLQNSSHPAKRAAQATPLTILRDVSGQNGWPRKEGEQRAGRALWSRERPLGCVLLNLKGAKVPGRLYTCSKVFHTLIGLSCVGYRARAAKKQHQQQFDPFSLFRCFCAYWGCFTASSQDLLLRLHHQQLPAPAQPSAPQPPLPTAAVPHSVPASQRTRQLRKLVLALDEALAAPVQAVALALQRSQGACSCGSKPNKAHVSKDTCRQQRLVRTHTTAPHTHL